MPNRQPRETAARSASFRTCYDALEQRRAELIARLAALDEKAMAHPAHPRARTLLNATFRRSSLVQRAAVLEAASWLITILDRSITLI